MLVHILCENYFHLFAVKKDTTSFLELQLYICKFTQCPYWRIYILYSHYHDNLKSDKCAVIWWQLMTIEIINSIQFNFIVLLILKLITHISR
jgi:hypothetical protein